MRRILLGMAVAALMVAVIVASALPALADPPPNKKGQYTCASFDPTTYNYSYRYNVPQGQTAKYTYYDPATGAFGYCSPNS